MSVREIAPSTIHQECAPGRIHSLGSARAGSQSKICRSSEFGLWSLTTGLGGSSRRCFLVSGNGNTPLRMMRSRASIILLLVLTRTTAKRCTVALDVITTSDKPELWEVSMTRSLRRQIGQAPSSWGSSREPAESSAPLQQTVSWAASVCEGPAFERTETGSPLRLASLLSTSFLQGAQVSEPVQNHRRLLSGPSWR